MAHLANETSEPDGLYLVHLNPHGLLRGHDLELGRDADTGGQTLYVLEMARALARDPAVARVEIFTRLIRDPQVDDDYARPVEALGNGAFIRRVPFGPERYLRKELLWYYLHSFVDRIVTRIGKSRRLPDLIHAHYADAGFCGRTLSNLLGVPLVYTGHSLGRVKRNRLQQGGVPLPLMEKKYQISRRIEAEELTLDVANLVVTSTHQEVESQYKLYDHYPPERMRVIPPGVDISRFKPPSHGSVPEAVAEKIHRFLKQPRKPLILSISRADERKNIEALVHAFGRNDRLKEMANLAILVGNRDDIAELPSGARKILTTLLLLIDKFDLYGKVAYPKTNRPDEVPAFFRLAARSRGVFVNPAFTEPFGLTLLEAAASGLPIAATNDGGPRDIIENCRNGRLIDPMDPEAIGGTLVEMLSDGRQWRQYSQSGLRGVRQHYTWEAHVKSYLRTIRPLVRSARSAPNLITLRKSRNVLPLVDRLLFASLGSFERNRDGLEALKNRLHADNRTGFGLVAGRDLASALECVAKWKMPPPDVLVASVGTEIYYGKQAAVDSAWRRHIDYGWNPKEIRAALEGIPGLRLQTFEGAQTPLKVSYDRDPAEAPSVPELVRRLRKRKLKFRAISDSNCYLDLVPVRASKGLAARHVAVHWGIPFERILVAGNSGNDASMLEGDFLGVVVADHGKELRRLRRRPNIFFANSPGVRGLLEGIEHYRFFEQPTPDHIPEPEDLAEAM